MAKEKITKKQSRDTVKAFRDNLTNLKQAVKKNEEFLKNKKVVEKGMETAMLQYEAQLKDQISRDKAYMIKLTNDIDEWVTWHKETFGEDI